MYVMPNSFSYPFNAEMFSGKTEGEEVKEQAGSNWIRV